MAFVKVNSDGSLFEDYSLTDLRSENPGISWPSDTMTNDAYLPDLANVDVFPYIDSRPSFDPETQQLVRGSVVFRDPDYVRMYSVVPYLLPSYLDGGTREPTSDEISANLRVAYDYYFWRVQNKIKVAAEDPRRQFVVKQRNPRTGAFETIGDISKAAKFTQVPGSDYASSAQEILQYDSDVWRHVMSVWLRVDPNQNFTGGGITPPTWPELEASIDTMIPAP